MSHVTSLDHWHSRLSQQVLVQDEWFLGDRDAPRDRQQDRYGVLDDRRIAGAKARLLTVEEVVAHPVEGGECVRPVCWHLTFVAVEATGGSLYRRALVSIDLDNVRAIGGVGNSLAALIG
mgnify:FL=1